MKTNNAAKKTPATLAEITVAYRSTYRAGCAAKGTLKIGGVVYAGWEFCGRTAEGTLEVLDQAGVQHAITLR